MIEEFFVEKFLAPLCKYYTAEATVVYGLILMLAVIGAYKLLQQLKIKIGKRFFIAILPFIIYGGWSRALADHGLGIYHSPFWCSPPIYFIVFAFALGALLLGLFLQKYKKIEYHKTMFFLGCLFLIYNAILTTITNWNGFLLVLGLFIFYSSIFYLLSKFKIISKINAGIVSAHLLDASASFTAIQFFGYYEQHVLPSALIGAVGPWIMFPLKILVVWAVLVALDKYADDKFFRDFLKIIILILGLALGIRDWLTVSML